MSKRVYANKHIVTVWVMLSIMSLAQDESLTHCARHRAPREGNAQDTSASSYGAGGPSLVKSWERVSRPNISLPCLAQIQVSIANSLESLVLPVPPGLTRLDDKNSTGCT